MIKKTLSLLGAMIVVIITIYSTVSCETLSASTKNSHMREYSDTINFLNYVSTRDLDPNCKPLSNRFYRNFGIIISEYYIVMDSLAIDLNEDQQIDTVIVLSPLSLEPVNAECDFSFDTKPKRLLVEITYDKKGNPKIREIFTNLVSDIGGVLSHYNGIFKTKTGYKIVHEAGSRYSWEYSMEFTSLPKGLLLNKILKTCSFEGEKINLEYNYNNVSPNIIALSDTLEQQCNCDEFWESLDKK
jgi:hypothetical protein